MGRTLASSLWSYQLIAVNAARVLTLASIVYAAWRFGATDPLALCHLAMSLGVALLLTLSCKQTYTNSSKRLPIVFLGLILAWIAYATLQLTTIADWQSILFRGVARVQQQWGMDRITLLNEAVERLNEDRPVPVFGHFASVIPEETRQALIPFLLACVAAVLSALLFNTRKSRFFFLWSIIANAAALAFWGIIQKASGGQQILPGVENTFSTGMPFASFIYKNAGAAALLPALAAIAAILYGQSSPRRRRGTSQSYRPHLGPRTDLLETKNLTLVCLAILIGVGLIASLSRAAWFVAILAIIVVALLGRFSIRRREHLIAGSIAGVAMLLLIAMLGIGGDIRARAKQLSINYVSVDERWSHWADGVSTSLAHFPSGSGLGTYGFATLPQQLSTRRSWFREAHNQYLEVLTESGLIGMAILLVGMGWFTAASLRLIRKRNDREERSWGYLGIALLVFGGVQSILDFVLMIPANLILYASLIGIIGSLDRATADRSRSLKSPPVGNDPTLAPLVPLRQSYFPQPAPACCGVALLCAVCSYLLAAPQCSSERALAITSVTELEVEPSEESIAASIAALSSAIETQPRLGALYERRANWHLAAYRLEVLKASRSQGIAINWADTQLENLFRLLSSQDSENRRNLLTELRQSPALRATLASGLSDLAFALSSNPLSPRSHLTGALLAPLAGMPVKPWLESASPLLNNSADMLYINGLLAVHSNEIDIALDQWSKSLSLDHNHLIAIMDAALQRIPAIQVATNLVPVNRPDYFVRIIQSTKHESGDSKEATYDRALSESIVRYLQDEAALRPGDKHATIARIHQLFGRFDAAVNSWQAALRVNARDPSYRLDYSHSLSQLGRNEEALKQAVLGQTLNPVDRRFEHLSSRIRGEIRLGRQR